jgi:ParB-like chromosome segregation protein Spo0J
MAIELQERIPEEEEVRRAMLMPARLVPEIPVYRMGRAYASLMDQGFTQKQIAEAVQRDQTHISRCAAIFRGLAVEVHEVLVELGTAAPDVLKIGKLARLLGDDEKPDGARQLAALQKLIGGRLPRPRNQSLETTVLDRFYRMRALQTPFGVQYAVIQTVHAVVQYLSGESESPWPSTTETPAPPLPPISPTPSTASTGRKMRSGSCRPAPRGKSRRDS